jgi:hypothetical protein
VSKVEDLAGDVSQILGRDGKPFFGRDFVAVATGVGVGLATGNPLHGLSAGKAVDIAYDMDRKTGLAGGAIASERDLGVRNQIQTVFYYTHYTARSVSGIPADRYGRDQVQAVGGMVNVVHRFRPEADRVPFLLAGVGFRNFWGSADLPDAAAPPGTGGNPILGEQRYSLGTGIKLAFQLGVGCDFNPRWRVTIRCQMSRSMGHTLPSLEFGAGMRF